MKIKRPPELHIPTPSLRRADVLPWLETVAYQRGGPDYRWGGSTGPWHFCFHAKLAPMHITFPELWSAYAATGYHADDCWQDPQRIVEAKTRWESLSDSERGTWFDDTLQTARESLVGRGSREDCPPGDDAFNTLWNGRTVNARYFFGGRSGGWLVIASFEGQLLDDTCELDALDYRTLIRLAELVRFVELAVEDRQARVLEALAFDFLENGCRDIPTHRERCAQWARDQSGEH